MGQYLQYLVILGVVVQLIGVIDYMRETLRGNTKPNKVTWLLWSVAPLIGAAAAFIDGVRWAILPTFMAGFGPLLVFSISFVNKNAYWELHKLDYVCGVFSVLALILWAITREPAVAIIFSIACDGFAAIPTLIKAWNYPETETVSPYTAGLFSSCTSFLAIKVWNFSSLAFPVYLVGINMLLIFSICKNKVFRTAE